MVPLFVISFITAYVHCMRPQSFLDVIYITTTLIKPLSDNDAFFKMTSNQTNPSQSLDLSVEEFIDGQENGNTKKKT